MNRIAIPLHHCRSRVPLVVFRTSDDRPRVGIVDTGSEVTMFDPSLIGNGMDATEGGGRTSFVGVNGEGDAGMVTRVSGTVGVRSKDGNDYDIPLSGVAYDCSNLSRIFSERMDKEINVSMILGSDFLKDRNSKIDFKKKTLTIDY